MYWMGWAGGQPPPCAGAGVKGSHRLPALDDVVLSGSAAPEAGGFIVVNPLWCLTGWALPFGLVDEDGPVDEAVRGLGLGLGTRDHHLKVDGAVFLDGDGDRAFGFHVGFMARNRATYPSTWRSESSGRPRRR